MNNNDKRAWTAGRNISFALTWLVIGYILGGVTVFLGMLPGVQSALGIK